MHTAIKYLIDGALATAGVLVGKIVSGVVPAFPFSKWVLGAVGLGVSGWGLNRDGYEGSFVAGFGLGLAVVMASGI